MTEIRTIPPKLTKDEWNALIDHALEKTPQYIIRVKGSNFESISGSNGMILLSGANAQTVIQGAMDAMSNGTLHIKPGTYGSVSLTVNDGTCVVNDFGAATITCTPDSAATCLIIDLNSGIVTYYENALATVIFNLDEATLYLSGSLTAKNIYGIYTPSSPYGAYDYLIYTGSTHTYAVNSYGVILTSGSNSATVINSAISTAGSNSSIKIRNGTYVISAPLRVAGSRQHIYGEGTGTRLTSSALGVTNGILELAGSFIVINDMYLGADSGTGFAILASGSGNDIIGVETVGSAFDGIQQTGSAKTGNKFIRCRIESPGRYCIYLCNTQTDNWISQCILRESTHNGTVTAGIGLDDGGQQIMDNHIWGTKHGLDLAMNNSIERVVITGNYIESTTSDKIKATGHSVEHFTISNNVFWDNITIGVNTSSFIYTNTLDSPSLYYFRRNTIVGNIFKGSNRTQYGIRFDGTRALYNTITANSFHELVGGSISGSPSSTNMIEYNTGYITCARGYSYLPNSGSVAHGLDASCKYVSLTASGSVPAQLSVLASGSDGFYVLHDVGDGIGIYWEAHS